VFKQRLSVCDMTPPMRNPPARRLEERGRRGWWPRFPSSPQDPHDRLRALLGLDRSSGYARTQWRLAGIPPQVFWPDFVEIATLLANYGVPVDEEVAVYRLAGVAPDLDLVCDIAGGLHAEYTVARMTWHVGQVRRQHAHALAAATGTSPT
jgi:hypothetical protein